MASGTGGIASGVSGASTVSGASGASASSSPRPAPAASGSTSRLVASGALGGIVALLLAGALQYGGVLPALGPGGGSGNGSTGGDPAEVSDLSARLQSLEQKVDALPANPQGGSDPALAKRVAALEDQRAAAPADAGSGSGAGIDDQELAGLRSQIEALRRAQSEAVETMSGSQAALSQRLEAAETNLNQPRQDVAVARAIAAAGLKAAIDRGGPFQAELETYSHAAADDAALPVLKSFAETGVPSRGELIRQVPSVASSIVKSAEPAASDASWGQRLLDSARGLVTIRPVGNVEGDSVPDIAARLEDKVKNGDLPGAAEEWNRLPEPSKQASAAFKQSLDARIRVEDLISGSLSQAVSKTVQETAQ